MPTTHTSSHAAFKTLPIVDVTQLFSEDLQDRLSVAKSLDQATRDAGFFYLKGHGIEPNLIEELKRQAKLYFAKSLDEKMAHYIGHSNNHSGYVPQGEEQFYPGAHVNNASGDLKEAYDIGCESSALMTRFTQNGFNQWPPQPEFKRVVGAYYDAMLSLSRTLFKGFALALGLAEDTFTQHLSMPPSQLRLIHYFDNPHAKETDSGIGAHTDYEFFTILLPTSPGLQAMNGDGEWISIPVLENCFVINIGDMMEVVSGGQYVATAHRVRQVKEERYAFPFFASLDYETVVAPIAELLDNDSAEVKPIVCGDHLLAQTIQTFSYLKQRLARGEVSLPPDAIGLSSFGHIAKKED